MYIKTLIKKYGNEINLVELLEFYRSIESSFLLNIKYTKGRKLDYSIIYEGDGCLENISTECYERENDINYDLKNLIIKFKEYSIEIYLEDTNGHSETKHIKNLEDVVKIEILLSSSIEYEKEIYIEVIQKSYSI